MINEIENLLINTILDSLKANGYAINYDEFKVNIEIPKDNKNGDYSTNVAMQLTRILRKNPQLIAKEIIEKIDKEKSNIEEIQIAGPGFINIFMKKGTLGTIINKVIEQDENYGRSNSAEGKSIDVEFVSANPTGDLHLGHARQAALGDSICRLLDAAGYKVTREYYINDAGNQIHNLALSLKARYYELLGRDDFALPEDGYHGEDVKNIAKTLIEEVGDKYLDKEDEESNKVTLFVQKCRD
jgi:arginyl-tRNA synthetase